MALRFGTFSGARGHSASHEGWAFSAGIGQPEGSSFKTSHRLREFVALDDAPEVLRRPLEERYDAAWVRARLPRVFGYEPSVSDVEKSLLWEAFSATHTNGDVYVFCCVDHYGKSGLMFSDAGPEAAIKDSIAHAFWSLILANPNDLADYQVRMFHDGAGVWLDYECRAGHLSLTETPE
jgi:hypothetical protein